MHRGLGWRSLNARQRQLALNLCLGSSSLVAYASWKSQRPLLAESGKFSEQWKSKPLVGSQVGSQDVPVDSAARNSSKSANEIRSTTNTPRTKNDTVFGTEGESYEDGLSAWQTAMARISTLSNSMSNISLPGTAGSISDLLLPSWAGALPEWIDKIRNELSMAPWSLSWEIWEDAHDPEINPEIVWDARVRVSKDLCKEELEFLRRRQKQTKHALAAYLDVDESEIHPDDVPVIAMCGSGGGLRALVAGASSYLSAQEDGLFDCVTYTAGVSGSCWLQSLYFSSIGRQNYGHIINHLKQRLNVHIAHPASLLELVSQSPTNKYLLGGLVEKLRGVPDADFGLVDFYGLALAARLLVPRGELRITDSDLKVSNQRAYTDSGKSPLPIYTAVRHEIPEKIEDVERLAKSARFTTKHYDWFQWFEWTPYEFSCEELEAGIPTWAVGRRWAGGRTVWRENGLALPELRIPLYMGIWGSAFCATLSHYYKEVRPMIRAAGLGALDTLLSGKSDELVKVHPIDAAVIPNFALGLNDSLPPESPSSIHTSSHLALMDAGMANNLPIYPLLRPGRNVDVIIAFDASADVRGDNWIKVVDGYVRQRGIKGWPMGAGWPPETNSEDETKHEIQEAQSKASSRESGASLEAQRVPAKLGHCTVWVGSKAEKEEYMDDPVPKRIETEEDHDALTATDAGIAVVYFPFVANKKIDSVDPLKEDFMSTWNFVYSEEDIDKVVALARANYQEGREQTRRTIRAVWERKRDERVRCETEARAYARRYRMKRGTASMHRNGDHGQGDQFGGGI